MIALGLTTLLAAWPAGGARPSGTETDPLLRRVAAAVHRTDRAAARTRIAMLRVSYELRARGIRSGDPPQQDAGRPPARDSLRGAVLAAWSLTREAERNAEWCLSSVRSVRNDRQARLNVESAPKDPPAEGAPLAEWVERAERAALLAEHAAQMAQMAADQAASPSGLLRD
jgi:hypothetical protein